MSRTADFAIQGFLYQFIITLQKILQSPSGANVTIEGIVEDIDIETSLGFEAIQCKYHESKTKFVLSDIYKPVLQMLNHFKNNETAGIKYKLHAHFPNEKVGSKRGISKSEIEQILSSKAEGFKKLISDLKDFKNLDGFIKQFEIEFGATLSDTQKAVIVSLAQEGFSTEDAEDIFYPNAIYNISEYSINHNSSERIVTKDQFLQALREKKKTAINRWTKELVSNEKLLAIRKKQLANNLNTNSRRRAIIIDSNYLNDFDTKVSSFIIEYLNKYNSKPSLNICPIFSLVCEEEKLNAVWKKLNTKNVKVLRGIEAGDFDIDKFLREPIKTKKEGSEFNVRICNHQQDFESLLSKSKLDDIIIMSDLDFPYLNSLGDINQENLSTPNINEIKYLLSLTNTL